MEDCGTRSSINEGIEREVWWKRRKMKGWKEWRWNKMREWIRKKDWGGGGGIEKVFVERE